MPNHVVRSPGSIAKTADPDALRSAREAAGLTQEQLAELNGVLPVEVAAWESGAVSVSSYEGEMICWTIRNAEYHERLARSDVSVCPWLAEFFPVLHERQQRGPSQAVGVAQSIAAHQARCDACGQARDLPVPPELPRGPGLLNRIDTGISRLPRWLRLPFSFLMIVFYGLMGTLSALLGIPDADSGRYDPNRTLLDDLPLDTGDGKSAKAAAPRAARY